MFLTKRSNRGLTIIFLLKTENMVLGVTCWASNRTPYMRLLFAVQKFREQQANLDAWRLQNADPRADFPAGLRAPFHLSRDGAGRGCTRTLLHLRVPWPR